MKTNFLPSEKILSRDTLPAFLRRVRKQNQTIVFTNGCFDLLHVGHLRYLNEAARLADYLVIGVNSDASVKMLKGEKRPIVPGIQRAEMICGLGCVDAAVIFEEETPLELIRVVRPDFLVKGGDWTPDKIVGSDFVKSYDGKCMSIPFVEGSASTNFINTVIERYGRTDE